MASGQFPPRAYPWKAGRTPAVNTCCFEDDRMNVREKIKKRESKVMRFVEQKEKRREM